MLTLLPKSVTTPVAIEVAKSIAGIPELAGVFAVLTGLLGSIIGPTFLKLCRINSDAAVGGDGNGRTWHRNRTHFARFRNQREHQRICNGLVEHAYALVLHAVYLVASIR